jgi:hypothetical protein
MTELADAAEPAPPEREPTPQEDVIYDALTTGDTQTIDAIAAEARPQEDSVVDPVDVPAEAPMEPPEQFDADYHHAWTRYQADNEAPEQERERLTAAAAQRDNHAAMENL